MSSYSPRQQHSTAVRLASGTPSVPPSPNIASTTGLSTSLPPLLDPASPRRELAGTTARGTQSSTAAALQASLDHDYPVAQLDAWPLSSRTSYKRPFAGHQQPVSLETAKKASLLLHFDAQHDTAPSSAASPISPRQRKALHRHAVLDESKSTPLLLQELQAFVASELAELARHQPQHHHQQQQPRDASTDCRTASPRADRIQVFTASTSLQRLQVFREAFQRVIAAFSVYAPVLAQIQDEYDRVIAHLRSQCLEIPTLHAQLQTLQTQCVHELSAHALDTKTRSRALRAQLKSTQGRLAALAAQHAATQEQNAALQAQIETLGRRNVEMQLSNTSLVHGIKRHDDTLRHIHERSREEGMALAQMASKYHHACEEIAELKKTIASLEEKVGGVHVAADKATIALLTRDFQDTHAKLQTAQRSTSAAAVAELQQSLAQHSAVTHAFVKVLETQGVVVNIHELLGIAKQRLAVTCSSCSSSAVDTDTSALVPTVGTGNGPESIDARDAVVVTVLEKLAALTQMSYDPLLKHTAVPSSLSSTTTFLTEPDEALSLDAATQRLSTTDLLVGKGFGADVPEYLQFDGVVRNLHFPRKKLEQILTRMWQQKDDLEKLKRSHLSGVAGVASASLAGTAGSGSAVPLAKVFTMMLQRMCPTKTEAIESAYNVIAALERFAPHASDCRLFLAILQGEIPEDARQDQLKEIYIVHDALAALEKDRNASSSSSGTLLPGRVPLADVIQLLRQVFPWKTEHALSALHRALLLDQRGHAHVDYAALLLQQDDKRPHGTGAAGASGRSHFVECLRAQYIDDLLAYRRHLQSHIQQHLLTRRDVSTGTSGSASAPGALSSTAGNEAPGATAEGSNSTTSAPLPVSSTPAATASGSSSIDASNSDASAHSAMVSIRELRDVLQVCDVAKPVQEINRLLATAAALSMDQILTQDAMMVNAQQFLRKLPTLLIKPTGKFHTSNSSSSSSSSGASAAVSAVNS